MTLNCYSGFAGRLLVPVTYVMWSWPGSWLHPSVRVQKKEWWAISDRIVDLQIEHNFQ